MLKSGIEERLCLPPLWEVADVLVLGPDVFIIRVFGAVVVNNRGFLGSRRCSIGRGICWLYQTISGLS